MKYVKENMTLVICGSVVLLMLIYTFAPIPGFSLWDSNQTVMAAMQDRYTLVGSLQQDAAKQLELASDQKAVGVPSQAWVDARKENIQKINTQEKALSQEAESDNASGRVDKDNDPILPVVRGNGIVRPGLLPVIDEAKGGDPGNFKSLYGQQFRLWTGFLATGQPNKEMEFSEALPPSQDLIKAEWDDQQKKVADLSPGGATQSGAFGGMGGGSPLTTESQKQFIEFAKGRIQHRAYGDSGSSNGLWMYVEPTAFQRRPFVDSNSSPDPTDIFPAFVDSWLQADVVKAIYATNAETLGNGHKDVGRSAIKRLVRIVVGDNATTRFLTPTTVGGGGAGMGMGQGAGLPATDPGALFFQGVNTGTGGVTGQQVTGASVSLSDQGIATTKPTGVFLPTKENATDYTLGMTGRAAGKTYDVVYMSVVMDMDPSKLFAFTDKFYRQNMGYTIVNVQMHTVDPLERASYGYLYGDGQVVEVELLVECVLFRKWTEPLMPVAVKQSLGGTSTPPAQ